MFPETHVRRPGEPYCGQVFPTRISTFVIVLGVLVVAGVLGLGAYLAFAGDVLIWLLEALLLVALVRLIWRRAAERRR
jgi:hypothetical protein